MGKSTFSCSLFRYFHFFGLGRASSIEKLTHHGKHPWWTFFQTSSVPKNINPTLDLLLLKLTRFFCLACKELSPYQQFGHFERIFNAQVGFSLHTKPRNFSDNPDEHLFVILWTSLPGHSSYFGCGSSISSSDSEKQSPFANPWSASRCHGPETPLQL